MGTMWALVISRGSRTVSRSRRAAKKGKKTTDSAIRFKRIRARQQHTEFKRDRAAARSLTPPRVGLLRSIVLAGWLIFWSKTPRNRAPFIRLICGAAATATKQTSCNGGSPSCNDLQRIEVGSSEDRTGRAREGWIISPSFC